MTINELITAVISVGVFSAIIYVAICIREKSEIYVTTIACLIFGWVPLAIIAIIIWLGTLNENRDT